jgi:hypothetical protein
MQSSAQPDSKARKAERPPKVRRISDVASGEEDDARPSLKRKRVRKSGGSESGNARRKSRETTSGIDTPVPDMEPVMDWKVETTVELDKGRKRARSSTGSIEAAPITKKSKADEQKPIVETLDISAEVEERLRMRALRNRRVSDGEGEAKVRRERKRRSSGIGSGSEAGGRSKKRQT